MATFIDTIFLVYMFIGLYMLGLLVLIYVQNKDKLFTYPKMKKHEGVSIVMPCYNESNEIGAAIESLLDMDWPKDLMEIIIVDDLSSDNSVEIIQKYVDKDSRVRLIINERNSGGAAEPTNIGVKAAKFDYIAVSDADSTPQKDALKKMIGYLQDDKRVGGVTCAVLANQKGNYIQRLQEIEYLAIAFGRKLLDLVDSVYVTPGPFALYRKKTLFEVGLFDPKNMTQDIEIVWRMLSHGYVARMCLATRVISVTPNSFRVWWKQRLRWNIGGKQTLWKYKGLVFRKGMLGAFIIPFFSLSLFLGVFGLGIFLYLAFRRVLVSFLATKYSVYASTAILTLEDFSFSPSVLNFFGVIMFIMGAIFTLFGLGVMEERKNIRWLDLAYYWIFYLTIYPFIVVHSLWQIARGSYSW